MQINVFGKAVSWNGKTFASYFTRLRNSKTGEEKTFNVKFRQDCDQPELKNCPCIIEVPREKMNLQEKIIMDKESGLPFVDENGQVKISRNIWISAWDYIGPFIDHSLDDYE